MPDSGRRVFLSHASEDLDAARGLALAMGQAGAEVWADFLPDSLPAGTSWMVRIERALRECDAFVVVIGARGVEAWVRAEVEVALDRAARDPAFRLTPAMLPNFEPSRLPELLRRFQGVTLKPGGELPDALLEICGGHLLVGQRCPFPGLEAYDEPDADLFFGREEAVTAALAMMNRDGPVCRWLQVEGASGSGKSSFAQAGLVPAIRRGGLSRGPAAWFVAVTRPGRRPIANLLAAVGRATGADPLAAQAALQARPESLGDLLRAVVPRRSGLLLVIDQLEELVAVEAEERDRYERAVTSAVGDTDGPLWLVTTIRSDFLAQIDLAPRLAAAMNQAATRFHLGPASREALGRIVEGPAARVGLRVESGLADRILADASSTADLLPLVAHVLRVLWDCGAARTGLLAHADYAAIGGVGGALSRSADATLGALPEAGREIARELLLAMTRPGRGAGDARRVVALEELLAIEGGPEKCRPVLHLLSGGRAAGMPLDAPAPPRLVRVTDDHAEIVHEALLREWGTLRGWIEAERRRLEARDDLLAAARAWDSAGRPEDGLPAGRQLQYFAEAGSREALSAAFVAVARAREAAAFAAARRARRIRKGVGLAAFLGISLVAAGTSRLWLQARAAAAGEARASAEARVRQAEALAQDGASTLADLPHVARAKARASLEIADTPLGRLTWAALARDPRQFQVDYGDLVYDVDFSRDGRMLYASGGREDVVAWNLVTGATRRFRGLAEVWAQELSPDGTQLAATSRSTAVQVWDVRTGQRRQSGALCEFPRALVWSADGSSLFVGCQDGTLARLDPVTLAPVATWQDSGRRNWAELQLRGDTLYACREDGLVSFAAMSLDEATPLLSGPCQSVALFGKGELLVLAGTDVMEVGPSGTRRVARTAASRLALSDAEGWFVSAGADGALERLDIGTGASLGAVGQLEGRIMDIAVDGEGGRLAAASFSQQVKVWSTRGAKGEGPTFTRAIVGADISPDGARIAYGGWNDQAIVRDVATRGAVVAARHRSAIRDVRFFGDVLWTAGNDRAVNAWDGTLPFPGQSLTGFGHMAWGLAFSPGGERVVATSYDGHVRAWELPGGALAWDTKTGGDNLRHVSASRDGGLMLVSSATDRLSLDTASGRVLHRYPKEGGSTNTVSFGPDDDIFVDGAGEAGFRVVRLDDGAAAAFGKDLGLVNAIARGPDGRMAVSGDELAIYDRAGWPERPRCRLPMDLGGEFARMSVDGRRLVVTARTYAHVVDTERCLPIWRPDLLLPGRGLRVDWRGRLLSLGGGQVVEGTELPPVARAWLDRALASASAGDRVALLTNTGQIEVWTVGGSEPDSVIEAAHVKDIRLTPSGIATLGRGVARLFRCAAAGCEERELSARAAALARDGDALVVLEDSGPGQDDQGASRAIWFDSAGNATVKLAMPPGATALARVGDQLYVGLASGGVVPWSEEGAQAGDALAGEPGNAATWMAPARAGVLVGYADGAVGLWDGKGPVWNDRVKVEGRIVDIVEHAGAYVATSTAGDVAVMPAPDLDRPWCDLLDEVWAAGVGIWENGAVVDRGPADHPCRR
jgi:WD40 repeat protein